MASTPKQLAREFRLNLNVINLQVKGLSHEDTLRQPPFRGNCLNWILGHVVTNRMNVHSAAGLPMPWDTTAYAHYQRESDPITGAEDALPLEQILADLAASQEMLLGWLSQVPDAELDVVADGQERSVAERLSFLSWHETFHVGQTELLRQLTGVDDKVN